MEKSDNNLIGTSSWVNQFIGGVLTFSNIEQLKDEKEDLEITLYKLGTLDEYAEAINKAYFRYKNLLAEV